MGENSDLGFGSRRGRRLVPFVLSLALVQGGSALAGRPPSDSEVSKALGIASQHLAKLRFWTGFDNKKLSRLAATLVNRLKIKLNLPNRLDGRRELRHQGAGGALTYGELRKRITEAFSAVEKRRFAATPGKIVAGIPVGSRARFEEPSLPEWAKRQWKSLGPGNIGGRIRSLVLHPQDPNRMWAGSVSGGIWYTTDGGRRWAPVDDFLANLAVSALAIHPKSTKIMYAGTGEGIGLGLRGGGIFKSTDGGNRWLPVPGTQENDDFQYVNRIAVSPDGKLLVAATNSGLFYSSASETVFAPKSSWKRATLAGMPFPKVMVTALEFDPRDAKRAVAGQPNAALYSEDGGKNWKIASPGWKDPNPQKSVRVEVTYAKANPAVVYASVDGAFEGISEGKKATLHGQVWMSVDGGKKYTHVQNVGHLGDQGFYANVIWAGDPTTPDLVVVGGFNLWRKSPGPKKFVEVSAWLGAVQTTAHPDHHLIVSHPRYDGKAVRTVFFGNDGGLYRADDVRAVEKEKGWTELNNYLSITQLYGVAVNPVSGVMIGGTQDNGVIRLDPFEPKKAEGWTGPSGGEGDAGHCATDPSDRRYFYSTYVRLCIRRSTDEGKTFRDILDLPPEKEPANFYAPILLDPNNSGRLFAGGGSLWRTNNVKAQAPKWQTMKKPVTAVAADGTTHQVRISAIEVAKGKSDLIWVGHNGGELFRTTNGTAAAPTWQAMHAVNTPRRVVTRITIDPKDHNRVFVTYNEYEKGNVWRTMNGGQTWEKISSGLPAAPVRTLAIHPYKASNLYIGTEVGIFASENDGKEWWPARPGPPENIGPANVRTDQLTFVGQTIIAATHGRGVWARDIPVLPTVPPDKCVGPTEWTYTVKEGIGGPYQHTEVLLGKGQGARWKEMFPFPLPGGVYRIPDSWVPIVKSRMPIPNVSPAVCAPTTDLPRNWTYTVQANVGGPYQHTQKLLGKEQGMRWPEMFPYPIYVGQLYKIPGSWVPIVNGRMPITGVSRQN